MGLSDTAPIPHSILVLIHRTLWDTNTPIIRAHLNRWLVSGASVQGVSWVSRLPGDISDYLSSCF
jgi:hypothetical protein